MSRTDQEIDAPDHLPDEDEAEGSGLLRLLRNIVLTLVVLVLSVLVGGGWYFAGQIHSEALEVKPYVDENNLTLTPAGRGTMAIEVADEGELEMLDGPSTFGVEWSGGYGQVSGPVVESEGTRVVRRFEVFVGAPPAKGTKANLELAAFPEDARFALGERAVEVEYDGPLGPMPAWFVPAARGTDVRADAKAGAKGDTWAVLVHGKGATRSEMFRMGQVTTAAGMPTLDIGYRNDEGVPRDPSGLYQFGRTEWRDLEAAIDYAAEKGARKVLLGGDSMGGGIIAAYLEGREAKGGPDVVGVILDSPMLDFGETIEFGAEQLPVPVIGEVPSALTWSAMRIASLRYDVDWEAVDYLDDTSWLSVPALVFHGTADLTVPPRTSTALAKAEPDLVTLVVDEGVEHVRSWNDAPAAYAAEIRKFLDRL